MPVSVIPFGMPPAADSPRQGARSNPLIVSLGDVDEVRGMATLINAFALLCADLPAARLLMTGCVVPAERWRPKEASEAPNRVSWAR